MYTRGLYAITKYVLPSLKNLISMKSNYLITSLILLLGIFSCEKPEVQPNFDLFELVANDLEKQGLSVTRVTESNQTLYVIAGSPSLNELATNINSIFESNGHDNYQFTPTQGSMIENGRVDDISCESFDIYEYGGVPVPTIYV